MSDQNVSRSQPDAHGGLQGLSGALCMEFIRHDEDDMEVLCENPMPCTDHPMEEWSYDVGTDDFADCPKCGTKHTAQYLACDGLR